MIHAYGLFWDVEEIEWSPGHGTPFRMLGRINQNKGTLRIIDARFQRGIYILYSNHGPHYVGLAKEQDLGIRIKQHLTDGHEDKWVRFSWFGFRKVLKGKDGNGFCKLAEVAETVSVAPNTVIQLIEGTLIRAMGLANKNQMGFGEAKQWRQIKLAEQQTYLVKLE